MPKVSDDMLGFFLCSDRGYKRKGEDWDGTWLIESITGMSCIADICLFYSLFSFTQKSLFRYIFIVFLCFPIHEMPLSYLKLLGLELRS